jgi:hypothetical protein
MTLIQMNRFETELKRLRVEGEEEGKKKKREKKSL